MADRGSSARGVVHRLFLCVRCDLKAKVCEFTNVKSMQHKFRAMEVMRGSSGARASMRAAVASESHMSRMHAPLLVGDLLALGICMYVAFNNTCSMSLFLYALGRLEATVVDSFCASGMQWIIGRARARQCV